MATVSFIVSYLLLCYAVCVFAFPREMVQRFLAHSSTEILSPLAESRAGIHVEGIKTDDNNHSSILIADKQVGLHQDGLQTYDNKDSAITAGIHVEGLKTGDSKNSSILPTDKQAGLHQAGLQTDHNKDSAPALIRKQAGLRQESLRTAENKDNALAFVDNQYQFVSAHLSNRTIAAPGMNARDAGICFPPVTQGDLTSFGCNQRVDFDYNKNRIPQVLPTVRCINWYRSLLNVEEELVWTICDEVKHQVPVLFKLQGGEESDSYRIVWNTLTLACVKSVYHPRNMMRIAEGEHLFPIE